MAAAGGANTLAGDLLTQTAMSADGGRWLLHCRVTVAKPRDEVFAFFERAENLNGLTPAWVAFEIVTPTPIEMKPGALIDYRISLRGLPMRWRTRISVYEPPVRFVDEQIRGPYRVWHHEHGFEPVRLANGELGTIVTDRVQYELKWPAHTGPIASLVRRWLVRPDLDRIFGYRTMRMHELFGKPW